MLCGARWDVPSALRCCGPMWSALVARVLRFLAARCTVLAAHCCLLDPTRPYQKLPLHLLEPSLIFLSFYYNNMRVYIALWHFTNIP